MATPKRKLSTSRLSMLLVPLLVSPFPAFRCCLFHCWFYGSYGGFGMTAATTDMPIKKIQSWLVVFQVVIKWNHRLPVEMDMLVKRGNSVQSIGMDPIQVSVPNVAFLCVTSSVKLSPIGQWNSIWILHLVWDKKLQSQDQGTYQKFYWQLNSILLP